MSWIQNHIYVRHAKKYEEIGQWQIKKKIHRSHLNAPSANSYIFSPRGLHFSNSNCAHYFLKANF
jgi:hypothetical protein